MEACTAAGWLPCKKRDSAAVLSIIENLKSWSGSSTGQGRRDVCALRVADALKNEPYGGRDSISVGGSTAVVQSE